MYVSPEELSDELKKYKDTCKYYPNGKIKERGNVSNKLGQIILNIVEGLARKGNWSGYTWNEDMVGEGALTIIKYMHNVDTQANIHAYLTKIAQHAFIQYNKKQKAHSIIKDKLYDFDYEVEDEYMSKALDYQSFNK